MIVTDFDGVITNNSVYVSANGEMTRKLNFKDIMAISLLKKNGYKVAIISGEANSAIELLKEKFDIEEVHQGIRNKLEVLERIVDKYSLTKEDFIYIGDDVNDYDSLCFAKYAITVPDALKRVKSIPHIQVTESRGGEGAFREIVDSIIYK